MLALPKTEGEAPPGFLTLATVQGKVKRLALADLAAAVQADPLAIGLDGGDELLWAGASTGDGQIMLATAQGQAIRFGEDEVRAMGLSAGGIGGIKLQNKDRVVAAAGLPATSGQPVPAIALITALGFGKRTPLAEFPIQGRNGQGVKAVNLTPKSGALVTAALMGPQDRLLSVSTSGKAALLAAAALPEMARAATGKQIIALATGQIVDRCLLFGSAGPETETGGQRAEAGGQGAAPAQPKRAGKVTESAAPAPAPAARGRSTAGKQKPEGRGQGAEAGGQGAAPAQPKRAGKVTESAAPAPAVRGRKVAGETAGVAVEPAKGVRKPVTEPAAPMSTPTKSTRKTASSQQSAISSPSPAPTKRTGKTASDQPSAVSGPSAADSPSTGPKSEIPNLLGATLPDLSVPPVDPDEPIVLSGLRGRTIPRDSSQLSLLTSLTAGQTELEPSRGKTQRGPARKGLASKPGTRSEPTGGAPSHDVREQGTEKTEPPAKPGRPKSTR
jgi:DNA gyrase subunit A